MVDPSDFVGALGSERQVWLLQKMCGLCLNVLQQGGPQSAGLGNVGAGGDYRTKLFLTKK